MVRFQRVIATGLCALVALPLSVFGESRAPQRTDLRALAAELAAVLGKSAVEVSGEPFPSRSAISLDALVDEMNSHRSRAGLHPLRLDGRLNRAAADRVRDMFEQRYFDHIAPDGTQPFVWARRHAYRYRSIGENLAASYPSARRVVAGWMNSPGHRANILSRNFSDVGLAVSEGFPGRGRYSGPTVVALYAREM